MLVKNLKGTSDNKCNCGTWLRHWEVFSGKKANLCCVSACLSKATIGAHIKKAGITDSSSYIVPFCDTHNKSENNLEIGTTTLVSANVSITCGKKK